MQSPASMDMINFRLGIFCAPLWLLLFNGCLWLDYLPQAAAGQLDLLTRGTPIREVLHSPWAGENLKQLLLHMKPLRIFAKGKGLKVSGSFQRYAELNRGAAVWVVTASSTDALVAKVWSFPFVGSFPYLGFFDETQAEVFASTLEKQDLDVYVRPAAAYSTLGYFDDPLLSTMISRHGDHVGQLAEVVLHESVHATLHIKNQSTFNETIAEFVGVLLAQQYVRRYATIQDQRAYAGSLVRAKQRENTLVALLKSISKLYAAEPALLHGERLERKAEIFGQARKKLNSPRTLNNAAILSFRTYHANRGVVQAFYKSCGESFASFLGALMQVDAEDFDITQQSALGAVFKRLRCGVATKAPRQIIPDP